ncbi:MAG: hypothetical protein Q9222_005759 [Ikaeria aurantiellina]
MSRVDERPSLAQSDGDKHVATKGPLQANVKGTKGYHSLKAGASKTRQLDITLYPEEHNKEIKIRAESDWSSTISILSIPILAILQVELKPVADLGVVRCKGQPYHLLGCVELRWCEATSKQSHPVTFYVTDSTTSCMVILGRRARSGRPALNGNIMNLARKSKSDSLPCESRLSAAATKERDNMEFIRSQIVGMPTTWPTSVALTLDWDPIHFLKTQFLLEREATLGSTITLTGSALCAQATTCLGYVSSTWPDYGSKVLHVFERAVNAKHHIFKGQLLFSKILGLSVHDFRRLINFAERDKDLTITLRLIPNQCHLNIRAPDPETVVQILQQVIWMGAVFRVARHDRVEYSRFDLRMHEESSVWAENCSVEFRVSFITSEMSKEEQSCWIPLFANPTIATGFPIASRQNEEEGLEIPLEMMGALGGAHHITTYDEGLVIKGHSAMFVPIKRHGDSIQWHLVRGQGDRRLTYRELSSASPNRATLDTVNFEHLADARHFLGWWKSAETHLGTADAAYDEIDWSAAKEPRRSNQLVGAEIGFQMIGTGKLNFSMGSKDGKLHFVFQGPFQRLLRCAESTSVVLYDLGDRRAWLVSALEVMLHIVMTRHRLEPYRIGGQEVQIVPAEPRPGDRTVMQAVLENQDRLLYEPATGDTKVYYFKDAIITLWPQMERLMEKDDRIEASQGLALHGTMRDKLSGWEYMSLVHDKTCHRQKEANILKSSGGWVELVNDIDCLVLFAVGFNEIIKPTSDLPRLCPRWRALPKERDYLAGRVSKFEQLYSEAGSKISRKHLSTTHLQWHRGSSLFERCTSTSTPRDSCQCDRTQQVYHDSLFKTFGTVKPPGKLKPHGCVVFGQTQHALKSARKPTTKVNSIHTLPNIPLQQVQCPLPTLSHPDNTILQDLATRPDHEFEIRNGFTTGSTESRDSQTPNWLEKQPISSSKREPSQWHAEQCEEGDAGIRFTKTEMQNRLHPNNRRRTEPLMIFSDSTDLVS